jgi:hypothetical protein
MRTPNSVISVPAVAGMWNHSNPVAIADTQHSPVFTKTLKAPEMVFLKASLFDSVSPPGTEVFIKKQYEWVIVEHCGEKKE